MTNKTIVHIAHYAAPYKGNFIASLETLEDTLLVNGNNRMIYVFPNSCKDTPWIDEFVNRRLGGVFFVPEPRRKMKVFHDKKLVKELKEIFEIVKPDIIHTHFDGYDEYAVLAKNNIAIIWHYHNPRVLVNNLFKRIYQKLLLKYQYHVLGTDAYIIVLSEIFNEDLKRFRYRKEARVIPNGVQKNRISYFPTEIVKENITFLNLGGRADHKGLDILLKAVIILKKKNYKFCVKITDGVDTLDCIKSFWGDKIPKEIQVIPQTEAISDYYNKCDVFISASRRETFSFAIAEAMLSGTPIISSDIEGVKWALDQPSVVVFESENEQSLADKMERFILGKEVINQKALLSARQYVLDNYTTEIWSRNIMDFYDEILSNNSQIIS